MNVYDFDDTIYNGDSSIDFYLFCIKKNPKLVKYIPKQVWGAILYKLKRIDKTKMKQYYFLFLNGIKDENIVSKFWSKHKKNIKKWYLDQKKENDVIISASPKFLLEPICKELGVKNLIASEVNPKTGAFEDQNCKGERKVELFRKNYPKEKIDNFYSDSKSDLPLAKMAEKAFLVEGDKISDWNLEADEIKKQNKFKNISYNFLLLLSGISFLILNINKSKEVILTVKILMVLYVFVYIFFRKKDVIGQFKKSCLCIKILSILSGIGISMYVEGLFKEILPSFLNSHLVLKLTNTLNINLLQNNTSWIPVVLGILAVPFCIIIYSKIYGLLSPVCKKLFKENTKAERWICVIAVLLFSANLIVAFNKAPILYEYNPKYKIYDRLYTSDSLSLIKDNAWLNIYNMENDIRQPLFALFSSPFVAPFFAVFAPFSNVSKQAIPLAIGISQIVILIVGANILSHVIGEDKKGRIGFFILFSSLYSTILFSFMLEQYVTAFFWLTILLYGYINNTGKRRFYYIGSAGSLTTSVVLLPLVYNRKDRFYTKVKKVVKTAISGFAIVILSGRIDSIMLLSSNIQRLTKYTGAKLTMLDKFKQYSHFITDGFVVPNAGMMKNAWRLLPVTTISYVGIALLALCFISFIINRKKPIARISFLWVVFSSIILCVIGWGTQENGLILYALYFMWAFLILLYLFVKSILEKIKLGKFTYIASILCGIALFIINYSAIYNTILALAKVV